MDWESAPDESATPQSEEQHEFTPNIVIMLHPRSSHWRAVFAYDAENGHTEFTGSRAETITWARSRCDNVLIWSPDKQDLEVLDG
jgi:hypothetical protein